MILRGNHKSSHSEMNSAALNKSISKDIGHGLALPLTIEYLKNIKNTRIVPLRVSEKILNKWQGGMLHQNILDSCLFIPRTFRTIYKQQGQKRTTTTMLLWILPDQNTPHYLSNAKQMSNQTDIYWKNGPGHSLPPDPCKCYNPFEFHRNIRKASLSLPAVTLWHHACTSIIYDYQWSRNIPRKWSTQGRILGHREYQLCSDVSQKGKRRKRAK